MTRISESELIINPDNSIYHLNLQPEQLADTIITVGDPDRVNQVSKYFDQIDFKVQKREFVTHTGSLNGQRISVISTGIGIGLDGLMHFYDYHNNADETMFQHVFLRYAQEQTAFPIRPYFAQGDKALIQKIGYDMLKGVTVTCPGFYAPQERQLRASPKVEGMLDVLANFNHKGLSVTNFEMETAGIYGLGRLLGHQAISCNVLLANRVKGTFSKRPQQSVEKLIEIVLDRL